MKLYSVQEAAEEIGMTPMGVRHIIAKGDIPPNKIIYPSHRGIRIYGDEIQKLKQKYEIQHKKKKNKKSSN